MPNDSNTARKITYGTFEVDFDGLPSTSQIALARRGLAHLLGNEVAAKVTNHFDPDKDEPVGDTPEARLAVKAEFQQKAFDALIAGTVGVSTRGPSVDPITKIVRRLAKAEVVAVLAKSGAAWPKKAEDVVTFPDGQAFTGDVLIDRRIAKHGDRLLTEAKKIAAEQARKLAKAKEKAEGESMTDLI